MVQQAVQFCIAPAPRIAWLQAGGPSIYFSTFTPFQNATYPLICFAASFGSG